VVASPLSPSTTTSDGAPDFDRPDFDRAANLLGALSLAVADRMAGVIADTANASTTAATALSALGDFLDGTSIDLLSQVLGLTSSGTVRLVDRLSEAGYVRRAAGGDARTKSIVLTAAGRRVAGDVAAARADLLSGALADLTPAERGVFEGVVGRVLAGLVRGPGATRWICRLCDTTTCGRAMGQCPLANASAAADVPRESRQPRCDGNA
jgi:DNA-binding MarR family transcriptional regulator